MFNPTAARSMYLALSCALLAPALVAAQVDERTAGEVQAALESRHALVVDFTADFVQTYEGGMLRSRLVERGTVRVKRPGLMRWDYVDPEPKLYLADGERFYSYLELDAQVLVGAMPSLDEATTAMQFLAGAGSIVDDFTAAFDVVDNQPEDTIVLRLDPIRSERDFEFLVVVLDQRTLAIHQLVAHDFGGGVSTYQFGNLQENTGLTDSPFKFDIPAGAHVIDLDETSAAR